jgi:hypothetical protein
MHFIMVGVLGVDGAAVDVIHDVVDGKKAFGASTQHPPSNVEIGHFLLGHWLGLEMNLEDIGVIAVKLISNPSSKLLPRGLHHMLPSHPLQRAIASLILKKHYSGIELTYHLFVVVVREGHQRNEPLFFTYLKRFSKVLEVRVELVHADGVLGAAIELFDPIDLIVDPLLVDMMKIVIGALTSVSW